MNRPCHLLVASTLSLALLVGCQNGPQPSPTGVTPAASTAPTQTVPIGVNVRAELDGQPFADAEVKIYKPGQATPIATGKTGADGRLLVQLGNVIASGGGNLIAAGGGNVIAAGGGNVIAAGGGNVIAAGGGNVIAAGGGNVIAAGGGNVIASGGLNLISAGAPLKVVATKGGQALASIGVANVIASGGGNVIASGGGNVIAAGGGNVIASGGLNYRTQALSRDEIVLTAATTLAMLALGSRFEGAATAAVKPDGQVIQDAVESMLTAFEQLSDAALATLTESDKASFKAEVLKALSTEGAGKLSDETAQQITDQSADFTAALKEVAALLGQAITTGVNQGGATPAEETIQPSKFGTVLIEGLDPGTSTPGPIMLEPTNAGSGVSDTDVVDTNSGGISIVGNLNPPGFTPFDLFESGAWVAGHATSSVPIVGDVLDLLGSDGGTVSFNLSGTPDSRLNALELTMKLDQAGDDLSVYGLDSNGSSVADPVTVTGVGTTMDTYVVKLSDYGDSASSIAGFAIEFDDSASAGGRTLTISRIRYIESN